jgi:hypothetical protein
MRESGMLVGYVSDERYLALGDVMFELENESVAVEARSRANGAVYADAPPGRYEVTLSRPGYGAKRVTVTLGGGEPYQFRLLPDGVLGYAWPKWSRAGEAAEWRVHAPEAYQLELWRYGYHKVRVRSVGWFDDHGPRATVQLSPDGDYTQAGIRWNQVGYTLSFHAQRLEAPPQSGLYYFHARTGAGACTSFPWLVAPARPQAPVAVLASTLTWNAYNNYGGRSNYVNQDGLPPRPTVHARQDLQRYTAPDRFPAAVAAPLSFDRPDPHQAVPHEAQVTDPIAGRTASALAPGLWRLLGWLEREAFPYDLYADNQLHFGKLPLEAYRVLVLDNHPEYWTKEMYFRVKNWVWEQGGRLLYLGGCGLYAEAELPDEHTALYRNEGVADLRRESEASLLGVAYTHSGFQSGAPYRVLDDTHWAFAGTGLKQGSLFGFSSLHERCPGGASGHELDKISPFSPQNLRHLAKGTNPGDSGADMVLYETPAGGAVFAAGSLCWPLALLADDAVSAVTGNVLRRLLG